MIRSRVVISVQEKYLDPRRPNRYAVTTTRNTIEKIIKLSNLADRQGLEPWTSDLESEVLPVKLPTYLAEG